jgi:glyoxylase-like metal-dependent hydrolase (beta-lactamase superfamily II)
MPLPFALNHINLWLLEDELDGVRGWTAIDCGIASDPTRQAWERLFDDAFGGRPLVRLIATHFHPDHLGLSHWLTCGGDRARWTAPLWMTAAEYMIGRFLATTAAAALRSDPQPHRMFYEVHGVDGEEAARRTSARGEQGYARMVPAVPASVHRVFDGDEIHIGAGAGARRRRFRVITGFGHAPEHASLMCDDDRILIAGDMVLPSISTNVSVYDVEPEANPLGRYLDSIDRLGALPADTLVLPSHGLPFFGLRQRVSQLHAHHRVRLEAALEACATPRTAHELMPVLFRRPLDQHQVGFAFGETLSHLHHLWYQGLLTRERGADRVYRFSRA